MIINEYQYAKKIIEDKEIPKGVSIKKLISYIARYFYNDNKDKKPIEFRKFIFEKMKQYNLDSGYYRESLYSNYVDTFCKKLLRGKISYKLANPISVTLTKKEIDEIKKAATEKHQKLLFTMYVLAKTRDQSNGWINYSLREIFQYANINVVRKEKILMLNDLKNWGLIETPVSYTKVAFKVKYHKETKKNPIVFNITDFNNIGNQYVVTIRDGWKMCECCGRLIKIKGRANKYCNKCATKIQYQKINEYHERNKNFTKN